jgi:hypothetical protein
MDVENRQTVARYLEDKGFKHALTGYGYLITAISLCIKDPDLKFHTGVLYDMVASRHNTTQSRTERAIRHSIERSDAEMIKNSEFIARAADSILFGCP